MEVLGICLGASTLGMVRVRKEEDRIEVVSSETVTHEGSPRRTLVDALARVPDVYEIPIAITGRKFVNFINLTTISEPEAVERSVAHLLSRDSGCRVIVSAGGETFLVYHLDEEGKIQGIQTGNKCASGTGEFFLQQIGRMNLSLEDVARLAISEEPHRVSGRCSVFCKSDCTHALNKGVPKGQVVAGLAQMMSNKVVELLKKLLDGEIKIRARKNVVMARSFTELLENAIAKYHNRTIETIQVIEELINIAKDMREACSRGSKLGLTEDEIAFYDALGVNDSAVAVLGDDQLRMIAQEIAKSVRNNVKIDWAIRENVRAEMRVIVKRILRKHGYPPDKQAQATELVLEQAELICRADDEDML